MGVSSCLPSGQLVYAELRSSDFVDIEKVFMPSEKDLRRSKR